MYHKVNKCFDGELSSCWPSVNFPLDPVLGQNILKGLLRDWLWYILIYVDVSVSECLWFSQAVNGHFVNMNLYTCVLQECIFLYIFVWQCHNKTSFLFKFYSYMCHKKEMFFFYIRDENMLGSETLRNIAYSAIFKGCYCYLQGI